MKRILWFRRDLRIEDNPLLSFGGEVLPIFIFDTQILDVLPSEDRRVSFIFNSVLKLKNELQKKELDLKIFWGDPLEIFSIFSTLTCKVRSLIKMQTTLKNGFQNLALWIQSIFTMKSIYLPIP